MSRSVIYNTEERKEAIELIENPDEWPRWPTLPVKRIPPGEFGFLREVGLSGVVKPVVYLRNASDLETVKTFDEIETIEYSSFNQMFDYGWRID